MTRGSVIWITGLSGAGKTTVAHLLVERMRSAGVLPILLDGDALRAILGREQAFTEADRLDLAWVYARMCRELSRQGFVVICATISMFHEVRAWNRAENPAYCEVYLKAPLQERVARDPKGHYARAPTGDGQMVGLDGALEEPLTPDLVVENWGNMPADQTAEKIWKYVIASKYWPPTGGAATR